MDTPLPHAPPPPPPPSWPRRVARVVLLGALPGALFHVGLFALSVLFHARAEYLGVEDAELTARLIALFEDQLVAQQLGLLALHAAIGAATGLVAFASLALLRRVRRRPHRALRTLGGVLALTALAHTLVLMRSIAEHPAIYEPQVDHSLYLAACFTLAVDVLPRGLLAAIPWAFLAAVLALAAVLVRRAAPDLRAAFATARRAAALAAAVGLAAGALARVATAPSPPVRADRPNVLLIAVDSLRADMLRHTPPVTPHIDALAARGASFDRAYSVMPRTFPSWASILTGRYPHAHGVRHMFPPPRDGLVVEGSLPTLLAAAGYRTAVISDFAGDVFTRGDFGFEHVHAPEFTLESNVRLGGLKLHVHLLPYLVELARGAGFPELLAFERLGDPRWLTDLTLDFVDRPDPRPFFATVFYSSGHFPFASQAPYYDRFTDPAYRGRSRFHKATIGAPLDGPARAAEEAHIRGLYQGAVAASDAAIGDLLAALDARGLLDHTLVVVTADHGETLYEDGLGVGHGDHLYGAATLHVPLVFRFPGHPRPGARVAAPTPLVDIAPTLLARLGLPAPPRLDGVDQSLVIEGRAPERSRPIYAETGLTFFPPETDRLDGRRIRYADGFSAFRFDPGTWAIYLDPAYEHSALLAKHRALIADDRKLVYIPTRDGVRWELYDVVADPGDLHDLAAAEPARLAELQKQLYAWLLEDEGAVRHGDFVVPRGGLDRVVHRHGATP